MFIATMADVRFVKRRGGIPGCDGAHRLVSSTANRQNPAKARSNGTRVCHEDQAYRVPAQLSVIRMAVQLTISMPLPQ